MTDDQPSSELLKQLIERLDLLERVLVANTVRLHTLEKQLGIAPKPGDVGSATRETLSTTSAIKTEGVDRFEANQPTTAKQPTDQPTPVEPQAPWFPDHKWSHPKEQLPSATEIAGTPAMPASPPTHSWQNEPSASSNYETKDPHPLHHLQVEKTAGDQRQHGPNADDETWQDEETAGTVHEAKRRDLESLIGGSWFNWIGIVAVTLGVAFFLKLAFDKQWIGPTLRVGLSTIAGVSLLYVG
jgi:uncharacterized membrane protein